MRPRPLSTRTYLKEISAALRAGTPAPRHRRDWSILKWITWFLVLGAAILALFWSASLYKPNMHDRETIDPATYHPAPEPPPWWIGQPVRAQLVHRMASAIPKGQVISSSAQLPALGHPGDQYYDTSIGRWWVWGQPTGYAYATWIDP